MFGGRDPIYHQHSPFCEPCTARFFRDYSTVCGICGEAILPFEAIGGEVWTNPIHRYAHLRRRCCPFMECWLGWWGLGDVIPIVADGPTTVRNNFDAYLRQRVDMDRVEGGE